jgi:hypothetical protein
MSPHCRFSDLDPFRLRIFSAQVGNQTPAHGDESNPLEISMSNAMKGKPGLATGLTTLGDLHPFIRAWKSGHRNLYQARIQLGPGPHPLPTALPREQPLYTLRHHCRCNCATSAGATAPPVPVLCATSVGALRHQCRCTAPPVPVLYI